MKREDFSSGKKPERAKDPAIQPKQTWRALNQHDFGAGLINYTIFIVMKDPINGLWNCQYKTEHGSSIPNGNLNNCLLTEEQILKNFDYLIPSVIPTRDPNNTIPQMVPPPNNGPNWNNPYQNQSIWWMNPVDNWNGTGAPRQNYYTNTIGGAGNSIMGGNTDFAMGISNNAGMQNSNVSYTFP